MSTGNERLGPPLSEALPSLAAEVMELLRKAGQEELTSQIPTLHVRSRCNCGDDFCATIHTGAGRPVDSIDLEPTEGMIILDVVLGSGLLASRSFTVTSTRKLSTPCFRSEEEGMAASKAP